MMRSVATMWWHNSEFPTPEEWQALTGFLGLLLAVVGILFTLNQLRLSREASQRAAEAAEAEARPYMSVMLELRALAPKDPSSSTDEGMAYITVESLGRTPARNIRLRSTPPFQTSGRGRPSGDNDPAHDALTKLFAGEFVIGMLGPGQKLKYILDFGKDLMDFEAGRPTEYSVKMSYTDAELKEYEDTVVIQLEPWAMTVMEVQPLDTIARQVRRISENGYSGK